MNRLRASSLAGKFRTLWNNVEVFGLLSTIRAALSAILAPQYESGTFDRRFGTDTSSLVSIKNSRLPAEFQQDARHYAPAAEAVVRHILKRLPIRPDDFVFVDAGSGKGRTILLASLYPYSKIVGVELSPVTSAIARDNIVTFGKQAGGLQQCRDIEVLCQNILDFRIPDANLVFFLYNPFHGALFEAFMERVHEFSIEKPAREVFVAYCNPASGEGWLQRSGHFRKIYEHRVIMPQWTWSLWAPVRPT